jgi:hypothetical protein
MKNNEDVRAFLTVYVYFITHDNQMSTVERREQKKFKSVVQFCPSVTVVFIDAF